MYTGKELKAPYPDELEYSDMDENIKMILKKIFPRKKRINHYNTKQSFISYPEIGISELLKLDFFSTTNNEQFAGQPKNDKKEKKKNNFLKDYDKFSIDSDQFKLEFDNLSHIKEEIYNQQRFINQQYGKIFSIKN